MNRIFGHRVVLRDPYDRIIKDDDFEDFASASPVYEQAKSTVLDRHILTLQHGARITFSDPEVPQILLSDAHLEWFRCRVQETTSKIDMDAVFFHG